MTTAEVQQLVIQKANQYGVNPNLALGIAYHESRFNPNAVNTANANGTKDWGVMQLNDTTVQTMGVSNPLDPAQNVDAGVRLLSSLLTRYGGDSRQALWAYASGPGNVGPTKTPNAIAQEFITFVQGYNSSVIPGLPAPDPYVLAETPEIDPYTGDYSPSDDPVYQQATVFGDFPPAAWIGLGIAGLVIWYYLSD